MTERGHERSTGTAALPGLEVHLSLLPGPLFQAPPDCVGFSIDDPGFSTLDTSSRSAPPLSVGLDPFLYSFKHS